MSLSTPKASRTFTARSGEAMTVSARLSGMTLEISVIHAPLGERGRSLNLCRQDEEVDEAPREIEVAGYLDSVERRAAVNDSGHRGRRSGKNDGAILWLD